MTGQADPQATATPEVDPLGLRANLTVADARVLKQDLLTLWQSLFGAPSSLVEDLERLRRWFDPVAQGDRLRRELAALQPTPPLSGPVLPPLVVDVDSQRCLITPEGRCALEVLRVSLAAAPPPAPNDALPLLDGGAVENLLLVTYRGWARHRLDGVLRLLAGQDKPLQIPAAGLVLALLVNRSTSPDRAMVRYRAGVRRQQVDDAFFGPVAAFTLRLSPKTRAEPAKWRLISGWTSGEARRRLGEALVLERERKDRDGRLFVREELAGEVLDLVVRDLRRGHRSTVTTELFELAWDDLVRAFRQSVPALAGYGLVHERPADTERLRRALLSRFRSAEPAP